MSSFHGHLVSTLVMVVALGVLLGGRLSGIDRGLLAKAVLTAVIFGVLPDIDTKSIPARVVYSVIAGAAVVLLLFGRTWEAVVCLLLAMVPVIVKHRGFFHSRVAMLLVPGVVFAVPLVLGMRVTEMHVYLYASGVAGYATHLLVDGVLFR